MVDKKFFVVGKRKTSVARGVAKTGTGRVLIDGSPVVRIESEMQRLGIMEPLMLAGDVSKKVDFTITAKGGGVNSRAEAIRQAIARGLVKFSKPLKSVFLNYDRTLLVTDSRRNEPHKPSRSGQGPRAHKQRSKR